MFIAYHSVSKSPWGRGQCPKEAIITLIFNVFVQVHFPFFPKSVKSHTTQRDLLKIHKNVPVPLSVRIFFHVLDPRLPQQAGNMEPCTLSDVNSEVV